VKKREKIVFFAKFREKCEKTRVWACFLRILTDVQNFSKKVRKNVEKRIKFKKK
jgi:hypothetical protein